MARPRGTVPDRIVNGLSATAIVTIAVAPDGFHPVVRLVDREDVVLVPFDNVLDTDVDEDQLEMGRQWAEYVLKELEAQGKTSGKILEVLGFPATRSTATARSASTRCWTSRRRREVVQVVGNWNNARRRKSRRSSSTTSSMRSSCEAARPGSCRRWMDAGPPFIPVAGESENGFRTLIAEHADERLKGISIGPSPLVAISLKAAISAVEGNPMPQLISVPLPVAGYTQREDGTNYWSDLPDNFFTANKVFVVNEFPPCGVKISGPAIMAQTEVDVN